MTNTPGPIRHYDLDRVDRKLARYGADDTSESERRRLAEEIVDDIRFNELMNELRCLRERVLSPCPDPLGHTHAREA